MIGNDHVCKMTMHLLKLRVVMGVKRQKQGKFDASRWVGFELCQLLQEGREAIQQRLRQLLPEPQGMWNAVQQQETTCKQALGCAPCTRSTAYRTVAWVTKL